MYQFSFKATLEIVSLSHHGFLKAVSVLHDLNSRLIAGFLYHHWPSHPLDLV